LRLVGEAQGLSVKTKARQKSKQSSFVVSI
jgi:hypothetical protein